MHQVIYTLPGGIPIYGFGLMLFLAFVVCTWLASRRARQEGVAPERIQDLAIWVFVGGILGARLTFLIVERHPLSEFFRIWDGGLVFYGGAIGGTLAALLAYVFIIQKHGLSSWKLADIVAPSVAMGLCLGRLGCFLNGCCYGNVACPQCPQVHFPFSSPPRYDLVARGYQTAAGFTLDEEAADGRTVGTVDPTSAASQAGLRHGDVITAVNGQAIASEQDLYRILVAEWPRGANTLELTVQRSKGGVEHMALPAFAPRTLGLHPTQVYSSIGNFLLFLLLTAYYPLRRRDGAVMVLLMLGYAVHRFLVEALRNDTPPVALGLTFSQNVSLILFAAGLLLALWLWRQPVQYRFAGGWMVPLGASLSSPQQPATGRNRL